MIDEFKASISRRGFSRPTHYIVQITQVPQTVLAARGSNEVLSDIRFHAMSAEIPGTQILTKEVRHYDLPQKMAYGKAHDDLNITFRMDSQYQVRRLFDLWTNSVYNPATGDVRFKNEYTGTIQIIQVDDEGNSSYVVEVQECFPTSIGQISFGWDQQGSFVNQPVTFSFRRLKVLPNRRVFDGPQSGNINRAPLTEPKTDYQNVLSDNNPTIRQFTLNDRTGLTSLTGGFNY